MSRWRKYHALPVDERRLLRAAAFRLVLARALLSALGVTRTRRMFARESGSRVDHGMARQLAGGVLRAASHLPLRTNCLDRSLALWWLLTKRGLDASLRIGVRKESETLAAHAWVEHDGAVLLDDNATHFTPFDAPLLASGKP